MPAPKRSKPFFSEEKAEARLAEPKDFYSCARGWIPVVATHPQTAKR
jgi:hypothetical protein